MNAMTSSTKVLFVDTNAFIQVSDLKDRPWRDLFPGVTAVDLMVVDAVIGELDEHKISTNERRRTLARLALQLIDKASLEPERALVLKDAPVRVRLVISNNARVDWSVYPNLDPTNPDHQLVAEALSSNCGAAVFSHDTGPLIRARIAGIEAYKPLDDWLLPTEQTNDQRKIKQLEREARESKPNIVAAFESIDDTTSEIQVVIPILQPLDPEIANRLANDYLNEHPQAKLKYPPRSDGFYPRLSMSEISGYDIDRYNEAYSRFKTGIVTYYSNFHEHVHRMGVAAAIRYRIKNDSGIAAEGLRVEFDLEGEGLLLAERKDAAQFVGLQRPKAPERPRSQIESVSNMVPVHGALLPPRDPVAFYWITRPTVFQCDDFRPRRDYSGSILVATGPDLPKRLNLQVHVEATNLRDPVNVAATLVVAEMAVEWSDPVVQAILPEKVWKSMTTRSG
jgi:hypothetical protein